MKYAGFSKFSTVWKANFKGWKPQLIWRVNPLLFQNLYKLAIAAAGYKFAIPDDMPKKPKSILFPQIPPAGVTITSKVAIFPVLCRNSQLFTVGWIHGFTVEWTPWTKTSHIHCTHINRIVAENQVQVEASKTESRKASVACS